MGNVTIGYIRKMTEISFFKKSIQERKNELGKVFYTGFTMEKKDKEVETFNFHFIVEGKYNQLYGRPKYLEIIQIPVTKEFRKFYDLYNEQPVKIFSNDPSFKYYMAYALNKYGGVIINNATKKHLGKALTTPARKNNPNNKIMMNKHLYFLTDFLKPKRIKNYLQEKYFIDKNKFNDIWNSTQSKIFKSNKISKDRRKMYKQKSKSYNNITEKNKDRTFRITKKSKFNKNRRKRYKSNN